MTQNVYASTDNHKQCSAHLFKMLVPADNTPPPCVALSELTLPSHIHTTPCYPKLHANLSAAEQGAHQTTMLNMDLKNSRQRGTAAGTVVLPASSHSCTPQRRGTGGTLATVDYCNCSSRQFTFRIAYRKAEVPSREAIRHILRT